MSSSKKSDGAVAVLTPEGRDLAEARARIARMQEWIESATEAADLGAAAEALREAREWMRVKKVAADLRAEAARVEAIALRRLGQMGCPVKMATAYQAAASGFAALSDVEFEELLERTAALTNPVSIWNVFRGERDKWQRRNAAELFAKGEGRVGPYESPRFAEPEDVAGAVRTLLAQASQAGDRFTVAEMTDSLVSWVMENSDPPKDEFGSPAYGEPPFITDPDFRQGMAEVVRQALRSEALSADPRMPAFVTYYDGNESWVRIPWDAATLQDLRAMARIRAEQARQLAEAARRLDDLVETLAEVSRANGNEASLARLSSMRARDLLAEQMQAAS